MDIRKGAKRFYAGLKLAAVVAAGVATVPVQAADEPTNGVTAVAAAEMPKVSQDEKGFFVEHGLWRAVVGHDGFMAANHKRTMVGPDPVSKEQFFAALEGLARGNQKSTFASGVDQPAFKRALTTSLINFKAGNERPSVSSINLAPSGRVVMSNHTKDGVSILEDQGGTIVMTGPKNPRLEQDAKDVCNPTAQANVTIGRGIADGSPAVDAFCAGVGKIKGLTGLKIQPKM
ncbi:hypothetical protein [Propionivibrio sp.]|uniref:hypothetical protein n=1 Tax=Propionivibrio sp. TaxID=2212460 RepID=UPI0026061BCD|nr:hypothetical protein [Propionivibrio sp.]